MNETVREVPASEAKLQAELDVLRKSANRRMLVFLIVLALCCGVGVLTSIIQKHDGEAPTILILLISALFIASVVMFFTVGRKKSEIKAYVSSNITRSLLEEVFQVEEYRHTDHVVENLIRSAALTPDWDRCTGSDLVRGKYRGHSILFSDVKLEQSEQRRNSDGDLETHWTTIFEGPWIFIGHDRKLPSPVRLREKPPILGARMKSSIETENEIFNSRFQILTEDGHTAFLVLTPRFMEYITSADAKAHGLTNLCFDGNYVCVAVNNDRDSFEPSGRQLKDIETLKAAQRAEISYITDILDELMENEDLFSQRAPGDPVPESALQEDGVFESSAEARLRESGEAPAATPRVSLLRRLNPVGLVVLAAYAVSAVYTLIALPYGITLSNVAADPDAVTVPTALYLLVLSVFVTGFSLPLLMLGRRRRVGVLLTGIAGTALLLFIHYLYVSANLA